MIKTSTYPCKMIAKDIPGAEGPCVNMRGEFFMVAPNLGQVFRVNESGETSIFAETGGIPAGLQCDRSNRLWLADMKRGILSISPEGIVRVETPEFDGKPMRGCNDCAFDSRGNLYVTAPAGSGKDAPNGEVFCRKNNGELVLLDGGFQFCNGIAVNADDRILSWPKLLRGGCGRTISLPLERLQTSGSGLNSSMLKAVLVPMVWISIQPVICSRRTGAAVPWTCSTPRVSSSSASCFRSRHLRTCTSVEGAAGPSTSQNTIQTDSGNWSGSAMDSRSSANAERYRT